LTASAAASDSDPEVPAEELAAVLQQAEPAVMAAVPRAEPAAEAYRAESAAEAKSPR